MLEYPNYLQHPEMDKISYAKTSRSYGKAKIINWKPEISIELCLQFLIKEMKLVH